jgi:membrane-bound ClpP family serine protease
MARLFLVKVITLLELTNMLSQLPKNFPYKTLFFCLLLAIVFFVCDIVYANPLYHTLLGEIDNRNIAPIVKALGRAKPSDTITIDINSRGGNIYSGLDLIKAMRGSKAHAVVVRVHGYALSVAALVALEADKIILDPEAELNFAIVNDGSGHKAVLKNTLYQGNTRYVSWFKDILEHKNTLGLTESEWSTAI